jgi:uncharacterized protein YbaR (Trm112 family)
MTDTQPDPQPDPQPDSQPASQKLSPKLLEALVCPATGGRLEYDAAKAELVSKTAMLAYPIRSGIPIMLIDEARKIEG